MAAFINKFKGGSSRHSTFFLQFTCKDESPERVEDQKFKLWILAGLHILTLIIYVVAINYLQYHTLKNKAAYEGDVIEIGSYTTEITDLDTLINAFIEKEDFVKDDESPGAAFKEWLIRHFEKSLIEFALNNLKILDRKIERRMPSYHVFKYALDKQRGAQDELTEDQKEALKIIDIQFAFE